MVFVWISKRNYLDGDILTEKKSESEKKRQIYHLLSASYGFMEFMELMMARNNHEGIFNVKCQFQIEHFHWNWFFDDVIEIWPKKFNFIPKLT